ncbi:MAG TPA: hypothetical protein VMT22_01635 [Terriglobales bacterium]|jgi:hypothetical protein|nr:hypothetical protein [Terriglobales bacterium]
MKSILQHFSAGHFVALILDNEVTVGEFVTDPPLPWIRLIQRNGVFQIAAGYPCTLTAAQAKFEMKNWDEVSLSAIARALADLDGAVDYVIFGNNAGQGLPLAQSLAPNLIDRAAIIYASSLPEKSAYEKLGYRTFFRRRETITHLAALAKADGRPLALCFVNTIQHNNLNYHDP